MIKRLLYIALGLLTFLSCNSRKESDLPIAEAFNNTLYLSQAQYYMPEGLNKEDSIQFLESFCDKWLKQQVLINAIDLDEKIDLVEIEEKIENQKNELIINAYQKHLIKYALDTIVSEKEIKEFYNKNEGLFKLSQTIINAVYIQTPKEKKHLKKVNDLLAKDDSSSTAELYSYCQEFGDTYISTDSNWVGFNHFVSETPFKGTNAEKFVSLIHRTYSTETDSYCFLKVTRSKLKGEIAPYEFYKTNIKNKILTDRKSSIFETTQEKLLLSAQEAQEIQTYVK